MSGETPPPPGASSNKFDYFADLAVQRSADAAWVQTVHADELGHAVQARERSPPWRRLFKLCFVAFCSWFAWQYYDVACYSFRAAHAPLQLGDVTKLTPDMVQHNTYVCVDGISEHRGMTQKIARVLGQVASPYWFFRLVGSRGVFIEVPPDSERFSTMQRLHVCGRAVDPLESSSYKQLIVAYQTLFATELAPPIRIIEADMQPGEHCVRYVVALLALLVVMLLQAWALWQRAL